MVQTAWHKLIIDSLDQSKTYYVKIQGSKLDHLKKLVSLYSVTSPTLDCRREDGASEQRDSELVALLSGDRVIRGEEVRDLCLG